MNPKTTQMFFAVLRSAISGEKLSEAGRTSISHEMLSDMLILSSRHEIVHLFVLGLKRNDLLTPENKELEKCILKAAYRSEKMQYELQRVGEALEKARIPFLPLKGAVVREMYPEAWMRSSSDIDILVHLEDTEAAVSCLLNELSYKEAQHGSHDVLIMSPSGVRVELHFTLIEDGRAGKSADVLRHVWDGVLLRKGFLYWYEMRDAYFYFYHIAHMAKHFETGGCGVRSFIDLWLLDSKKDCSNADRDSLLKKGGLLQFANASRELCRIWFSNGEMNSVSYQMQEYVLQGGVFGNVENFVSFGQGREGGHFRYICTRLFASTDILKRSHPILNKHPWLMPFIQVKRWFTLLNPKVASRARREASSSHSLASDKASQIADFQKKIGL